MLSINLLSLFSLLQCILSNKWQTASICCTHSILSPSDSLSKNASGIFRRCWSRAGKFLILLSECSCHRDWSPLHSCYLVKLLSYSCSVAFLWAHKFAAAAQSCFINETTHLLPERLDLACSWLACWQPSHDKCTLPSNSLCHPMFFWPSTASYSWGGMKMVHSVLVLHAHRCAISWCCMSGLVLVSLIHLLMVCKDWDHRSFAPFPWHSQIYLASSGSLHLGQRSFS